MILSAQKLPIATGWTIEIEAQRATLRKGKHQLIYMDFDERMTQDEIIEYATTRALEDDLRVAGDFPTVAAALDAAGEGRVKGAVAQIHDKLRDHVNMSRAMQGVRSVVRTQEGRR